MIDVKINADTSDKFDLSIEPQDRYCPAALHIKLDEDDVCIEVTDEQLHDLYDKLQEYLHGRGRLE